MTRSLTVKLLVLWSFLMLPSFAAAQTGKLLLDTKIVFAKDGTAKVVYDTRGQTGQEVESNKIETWLVFYALAMNRLDLDNGKALMNNVQEAVSKIATEEGMIRADLLRGNPILRALQTAPAEQTVDLAFSVLPGQGHSLEMKPDTIDAKFLAPAVIYMLQDLVKTLSESGDRLMVLAMGGMNKWYREVGKPSDADSIVKAPSYALNIAVDILEKLSGKKKN